MSIQNLIDSVAPAGLPDDPRRAEIDAAIDALEIEPIRRQEGAGRSEDQWYRTQANGRYIHGHTRFPSPYARLAGMDDTIEESYTVCTGTVRRDDVEGAEAHPGIEDDDTFFLRFGTMEEAVTFCLYDESAPMEIELTENRGPVLPR